MKHKEIKELLPLYIDNQDNGLTDREKKLIEEHLRDCEECREELKQYQENQQLLSSLEEAAAPEGFVRTTLDRISEEKLESGRMNARKGDTSADGSTFLGRIKKFFTFPVRVPAGVVGLAVVIMLLVLTGLPGVYFNNLNYQDNGFPGNGFETRDESDYQQNYNQLSEYSPEVQPAPDTRMKMSESQAEKDGRLLTDSSADQFEQIEQKIIKKARLVIERKDTDDLNKEMLRLMSEYNGYVSDSSSWLNQYKQKFHLFTLRVPAENFDRLLERLSSTEHGQVISRSISGQDVTEEYLDLEIRLENLSAQEERYRELLDMAAGVEDILDIENELNRVRTEIERLQGRQQYLDNQLSYSTITVEYYQPDPIGSGSPDIIKALRNALNRMIEQFYQIIVIIGTAVPYLLLLGAGYLLYRKVKNRC